MEESSSNPIVARMLAVILLCVFASSLVFAGVGAWMLGEERMWTLAQWITGGFVAILISIAVSLPIFASSFPIRAHTRGPDQSQTQIIENRHHYDGLTKERVIQYGQDPDARPQAQIAGPQPIPGWMMTGGGKFSTVSLPQPDSPLRIETPAPRDEPPGEWS